MPLWPLPAIVVTLFTGFALMQQETQYLIGEVVVVAAGIALFILSKLWSAPAR
jgi:hypothetical protein